MDGCARASLQPLAPLCQRQGPQVLAIGQQDVVEANMGRKLLQLPLRDALAIEALLQIAERCDHAVAHNQELAVEHRIETRAADNIGKAPADVISAARE